MSQAENPEGRGTDAEEGETVLRAKYLDYCSARVAERLLGLTADEIYLLAQEAASEFRSGETPTDPDSYERSVRLATEHLFRRLPIPPFETWATAYREDPERFDREMLGLWRSEVPSSASMDPREREQRGGSAQGGTAPPAGAPDPDPSR